METEEFHQPTVQPKPLDPQETAKAMQKAKERLRGNTIIVPARATTPEGVEYLDKQAQYRNAPELTRLESILHSVNRFIKPAKRELALPYPEAAVVVDEIYRQSLARHNKSFELSEEDTEVVRNVTKYFIGDPSGPPPLNKGLFLYGNVGTGKTFLMEVMRILTLAVPIPQMQFQTVSTKDLVRAVKDAKSLKPLASYEKGGLLLDDLGDESGDEQGYIRLYSDKENPLDQLLSNRYIYFTRSNQITHATSNLDIEDIEKRYGTRIFDRFSEMFEAIPMVGESKRG